MKRMMRSLVRPVRKDRPSAVLMLAGVVFVASLTRVFTAPQVPAQPAASDRRRAETSRDDQPVLRRLSQRPRQDGGCQLPGSHRGEHRPARRRVREGGAQAARPRHAAARIASSPTPRPPTRSSRGSRARSIARQAPRRRTCPTASSCTGSIARSTRTRFAICWPWSSTPSEVLPADDAVEGFDNIAAALQVSPSFIEQYVIAARAVAVKAMGRPDARPGGWTFRAGPGSQLTHVPGLPLGTRGGILANVDLPSDGEYAIDIADMATHIWGNGMEFENPLVVTLDNTVDLRDGHRRRRGHEALRSGAERRARSRERSPEEHQVLRRPRDRTGLAWRSSGGRLPSPTIMQQMFSRGRRPGSAVSRQLVPGPRAASTRRDSVRRRAVRASSSARPAADATADAQAACAKQIIASLARQRLPPPGHRRGRQRAVPVLPRSAKAALRQAQGKWLRGRHPQRGDRPAGEPVLPVSQRARAGAVCVRADLRHQRSRAGVEAVVLPLELDPR